MDAPAEYTLPPDWSLRAVATQLSETQDWSFAFLGIPNTWKQTKGDGVTVAILDTGCADHPDLAGAIKASKDFTRSSIGVDDFVGHGTWCAGMVGARANNVGVIGVAPECQLLIAKVLNDSGVGQPDWIRAGIDWALAEGADIISLSLGGPQLGPEFTASFHKFTRTPRRFAFCAAGNAGNPSDVDWPAKDEDSICIGAVDKDGNPTRFSNKGPRVDAWCPGYEMLSTIPRGYGLMSGTSMSTPQAAGVAALALAKHKKSGNKTGLETPQDMKTHLRATSKNGLIAPEAFLAVVGVPDKPLRVPLFDLGIAQLYAPAEAGDDLGIVIGSAEARESLLAAVAKLAQN